jgi:hypothetical protein
MALQEAESTIRGFAFSGRSLLWPLVNSKCLSLLPFAALPSWRGPPARGVGVHADVLWHCAAGRPEVAAAGEDARTTNSN